MKCISKLLLCLVVAVPVMAAHPRVITPGIVYSGDVGVSIYASPDAAIGALNAMSPDEFDRANIVPSRQWFVNPTYPYTGYDFVSYLTVSTPGDPAQLQASGAFTQQPLAWQQLGCGLYYGVHDWAVSSFSTMTAAKTFYGNLLPLQRQTAYLLSPVGVQDAPVKYIVVYQQNRFAFCTP